MCYQHNSAYAKRIADLEAENARLKMETLTADDKGYTAGFNAAIEVAKAALRYASIPSFSTAQRDAVCRRIGEVRPGHRS